MREWIKKLTTEPDNSTPCIVRILAILGVLEYLVVAALNYRQHAVFDMQGFSLGFGGLIAGIGAALKLKKDSPDKEH